MLVATVKLSSNGQIVIPEEVCKDLHWQAGTQLTLIASDTGVTLKTQARKLGRNLSDLIGLLAHTDSPVTTEQLCQPVDYSNNWDKNL